MQTKILAVLALLLFAGASYQSVFAPSALTNNTIQRQEEVQESTQEMLIDVFYQASSETEEAMIDLLWLHQAAKAVLREGGNYFNILEQKTGFNQDAVYMEGIIEMTTDIGAEFSAEEVNRVSVEELIN